MQSKRTVQIFENNYTHHLSKQRIHVTAYVPRITLVVIAVVDVAISHALSKSCDRKLKPQNTSFSRHYKEY